MTEGLFGFVKWKKITWNRNTEAAWIHCSKDLATEQHCVSVSTQKNMFWRPNDCSISSCMLFEVQESQKLGAISSHEQLLRASTNCQMQTNTFNNLKLIYCSGKAVERKNKYI